MEALSNEELDELFSKLSAEKERRKKNRCYELIEEVCKSVNALHKEFPYVELCVPFYCSDCAREEDFDVLDHFHGTLTCNDFNYW
jgi:hypothetical protein